MIRRKSKVQRSMRLVCTDKSPTKKRLLRRRRMRSQKREQKGQHRRQEKEQLDRRYKLRERIHHSLGYFILFGDMRKCRTELPSSWTPHTFSNHVLRTYDLTSFQTTISSHFPYFPFRLKVETCGDLLVLFM